MTDSSSAEYFNELKEWSERKLRLIKQYLDGATRILGSINRVYYVDGFAGRGTYGRPNELQVPGSPLQAAELAQEYARAAKSDSLRCINVELIRETFDELQRNTSSYANLVLNLFGSFASNIDRILQEIQSKPTVCFLDPFGVDGIDWVAIQKLIRRPGPTDLWIRFDANEVRRRDGYFDSPLLGADKQFDILMRVYGASDKSRLHANLQAETPDDRRRKAVELYLNLLRNEFKSAKEEGYAEAYRIGSIQEEVKYYLVFATASKKGLVLASNIVYGIEENYQRELERYKARDQLNMFQFFDPTEDQLFESKTEELAQEIANSCRGRTLSRLDIQAHLLKTRFGIIKGRHLTAALKRLIKDKTIQRVTGEISNDHTTFTVS